jgi:hypothetical protein
MARPSAEVPRPLHPGRILVGEPGRALVRPAHRPDDPPQRPQERPGLEANTRKWVDTWNENPQPFTWTKTADEILHSLVEYLTKIRAIQPEPGQG